MLRVFFHWGAGSLFGHFVLAIIFVTIPLLLIGFITNIRAGAPMADLWMMVFLSIMAAIISALLIWFGFTRHFTKRGNND